MSLNVTTGHASLPGHRERNEDYVGLVAATGDELNAKGMLLAVADGVSGSSGGREAAEYTVRGLLADYYATPQTWSVPLSLDRILNANNRWLMAQGAAHRELAGMATTLSALVLRGSRYYTAHVGDTRIYLLRNGRLARLTTDHVWDRPEMQHVLSRAVGLDAHLVVDYAEDYLLAGDVFMLVSDGVWQPLGERGMRELLLGHPDPQQAAQFLAKAALALGGQDNASVVVARVDTLGPANLPTLLAEGRLLPLPARAGPGTVIDRFEVLELLHESRSSLLYKVRERDSGRIYAMKTLQPALQGDSEQCTALLTEEWLSRRVISHYFPQVLPLAPSERNYLYYVMSFHEGATLQARLDQGAHFPVTEVAGLGIRLVKGLAALHRLDMLHRDIKPANLHLGADGKLRILDLGVSHSRGATPERAQENPGTPSYMAPELLAGEPSSVSSDLYAAGVTLYHLLTRRYPYGEVEPFQHPHFGDPVPATRHRRDIPAWLDLLLLKAVARNKKQRFETAEEMLLALQRGEHQPVLALPPTPLMARESPWIWRSIAMASLVVNLLLLYLLLVR